MADAPASRRPGGGWGCAARSQLLRRPHVPAEATREMVAAGVTHIERIAACPTRDGRTSARYGLRGARIGEASHPG
eukprot:6460042-Pyramimonas_sp.AAC.1